MYLAPPVSEASCRRRGTEFLGRPRKTTSDQCRDTESTDRMLIYRVGEVQGHKTRHLLSPCVYVQGFAFLKNNQEHIIIILDINYTSDGGVVVVVVVEIMF